MLFYDWTMLLILPAFLLAIWAQFKVKSTYAKYAKVNVRSGLTGADVAREILRDAGIPLGGGVAGTVSEITPIAGVMTDHYDPRTRSLRLSEDVYYGTSIASLGVAAHEVGHAIQHAKSYAPMELRSVIYPVSAIGSNLGIWLFVIGFLFVHSPLLINLGILLFSAAVFFTVLTLPVELNASKRAMVALAHGGYLQADELNGARKVLTAAAMTYVAAALMSVLQLIRMILISRDR